MGMDLVHRIHHHLDRHLVDTTRLVVPIRTTHNRGIWEVGSYHLVVLRLDREDRGVIVLVVRMLVLLVLALLLWEGVLDNREVRKREKQWLGTVLEPALEDSLSLLPKKATKPAAVSVAIAVVLGVQNQVSTVMVVVVVLGSSLKRQMRVGVVGLSFIRMEEGLSDMGKMMMSRSMRSRLRMILLLGIDDRRV